MSQNRWVSLSFLSPYGDYSLLVLRVCIGAFLIWGVWDNIVSAEHMREFATFLEDFGFVQPKLLAVVSVWAQFFIGCCFVLGLLARWAGWFCVINFLVALIMVDGPGGIRASFPSLCLIVIGLYLGTHGPGRFSLDSLVGSTQQQRT